MFGWNDYREVPESKQYRLEEAEILQLHRRKDTTTRVVEVFVRLVFLPLAALAILWKIDWKRLPQEERRQLQSHVLTALAIGSLLWVIFSHLLTMFCFMAIYAISAGVCFNDYMRQVKEKKIVEKFLRADIKDACGFTPRILSMTDNQIVVKCPGIPLETFNRKKEQFGQLWSCRVKEVIPGETADQIVLNISRNLLKPFYPFDQKCIDFFRYEAPRESWLIGHDGDGIISEILGKDVLHHHEVAGATRMGKSNYLKAALTSLLLSSMFDDTNSSVECYFVDFKQGTEAAPFRCWSPGFIATDEHEAAALLDYIYSVMKKRLRIFSEHRVTNIQDYRELMGSSLAMRRIVVDVDEAADMVLSTDMLSKAEQKLRGRNAPHEMGYLDKQISICRRSACAGISMIYATQYPMADTIPSALQINLSNRICFKVPSHAASCNIINFGDSADLPTRPGCMVYAGRGLLMRLQALHIHNPASILRQYIPPVPISSDLITLLEQSGRSERMRMAESLKRENIQRMRLIHRNRRVIVTG